MSLSEIEEPSLTDIRADLLALHEEVCYIRGQWPRLEATVTKLDAMVVEIFDAMTAARPLLDRYRTVAAGPAARWVRGRNGPPSAHHPACMQRQHQPIAGCSRAAPHGWHPDVGCHIDPGECNG